MGNNNSLAESTEVASIVDRKIKPCFVHWAMKMYSKIQNQDGSNANVGDDQAAINGNVQKKARKRIYCCHVCGKKFLTSSYADRHVAVHEGLRFKCDYQNCDSIFTSRYSLQQHILIHTGEKPFSCPVCKKTFRFKSNLKNHERVHSGEKPYVCKVCEQRFSRRHVLQSHLRIHTGEKPHVCKVCDQKFRKRHHLQYHLRTHTGEKPYVCGVCDKTFNQSSNLSRHMKTHTIVKNQFTCAHCGKSYTRKDRLKHHLIKCFKKHDFQDRFDDH